MKFISVAKETANFNGEGNGNGDGPVRDAIYEQLLSMQRIRIDKEMQDDSDSAWI